MAKSNKSVQKRIKITKQGKMMSSNGGRNHYQAKKTRNSQLRIKRLNPVNNEVKKLLTAYLYR